MDKPKESVDLAVAVPAISAAVDAEHDARLLQVGSGGLYSYDAWTGKRSLLIKGMRPDGTPADMPYLSPHEKSVVTLGGHRTDRASCSSVRISRYPRGKAFKFDADSMCVFDGWADDYNAVVWIDGTTYKIDSRTGEKRRYSGSAKHPMGESRKTAGDKRYRVTVADDRVSVSVRSTGEAVASFKAPGGGAPGDWSTGGYSVSPDGGYIAFENYAMPYNDARVEYEVWVCTLDGGNSEKMDFGDGGFRWR